MLLGWGEKKSKKHITLSAHRPISDFTKLERAAVISQWTTDKKKSMYICLADWIMKFYLLNPTENFDSFIFILLRRAVMCYMRPRIDQAVSWSGVYRLIIYIEHSVDQNCISWNVLCTQCAWNSCVLITDPINDRLMHINESWLLPCRLLWILLCKLELKINK